MRVGGYPGWRRRMNKKVKEPMLPLEGEATTPAAAKGHGATIIDPRRKHKADKRKKHGG
jgi:hypothetical protein